MKTEQVFSSGVVVGMTNIPAQTIRRYIHDFYEHFTSEARKPTRGRKYTPQDVQTILLIRRMYNERKGKDEIKTALSGDLAPLMLHHYDFESVIAINAQTEKYFREVTKDAKRVNRQYKMIDGFQTYFGQEIKRLRGEIARLEFEIQEIKMWQGM